LNLTYGLEDVLRKPIVSHRAIEPFDIGVLLWLTGLDILDPDLLLYRPLQQRAADVFRGVVTTDHPRLTAPFDHLLQRADDSGRRQ
jgi:hypothetical protein